MPGVTEGGGQVSQDIAKGGAEVLNLTFSGFEQMGVSLM